MLYRYNEKQCLNGRWDFLPVFDGAADRTRVPTEGFLPCAYLVPSFFNKPIEGTRKPGDAFFRCCGGSVTDPQTESLFDAFGYPAEWGNLTTAYVRRTLTVHLQPERRYYLVAEAVGPRTTLFVNGRPVAGDTEYTLPFEVDVTDALKDGDNEIVYLLEDYDFVDGNRKTLWPSGNFIPHRMHGIWQDVYFVEKPSVMVDDITIVTSYRRRTLSLTFVLCNHSDTDYRGKLTARVNECRSGLSALPEIVLDASVPAHGQVTLQREIAWENPQLWDTESPFLYWLNAELEGKETVRERFGFREIWVEGIHLMLNGHILHLFADWGHKTTPFYYTEGWIRKWYGMIRDNNMNYSRLHTHPHAPIHLDIADEEGIFICGETGIHGSGAEQGSDSPEYWQHAREHIRRFVRRDKNHPCIILWSVENEMRWNRDKTDLAKKELPKMRALFRELDPTRPAYHEGDSSWWNEKDQLILSRHYGKECSGFGWWDKKQPLHSGEFCLYHYAGPNNTVHLGGDSVWGSLANVTRCAAEDLRLVSEDARANGVCALGPWNLSCLLNLRPHGEVKLTYPDETVPGVKPQFVHAGASEFTFWEEGKGYTPQPGTESNAIAFRPFAAIDLSHRTSFYGDAPIHKTLHLVNDTYRAVNGTVTVSFLRDGKSAHTAGTDFTLARGEIGVYTFDMTDTYPDGEYTYRVEVTSNGETLDLQDRTIRISHAKKTAVRETVYVLDNGLSAGLLARSGVQIQKVASVQEAPAGSILLIGKNYIKEESTINAEIRAFAQKGGRVIILEQQVSAFPQLTLEDFPVQTAWKRGYTNPICNATDERDLRFWGDDPHTLLSGDTYVADRMYVKDDGTYMDVLFDAGEGGFGYGDIHYCPMFCAQEGRGMVIASQFNLSAKYETVPAAAELFDRILQYAADYVPAADKSDAFLLENRTDDADALRAALDAAKGGKTVVISPLTETAAALISQITGVSVACKEETYGTWNGVRVGDLPELSGLSNEDFCGIERFSYDKETADNYRIARSVIVPNDRLTPVATTCPRSAMVPMYIFGGTSEMLRAYTATRYCYQNNDPAYDLICKMPYGEGILYLSVFENVGNRDGKPAPRLNRVLRRLCVNLGGKPDAPSALEGECTRANDAVSEGYPKMLFAWDGAMEDDTFKRLLACTTYQVERMNPTQALASFDGYQTLYSDDGTWNAADCPQSGKGILLYYTIFSPVTRKNLGSNLDVPDPAAQTYLDLTGEGEVQLWINSVDCGKMHLDGKGTFSDLELERMFNHIVIRWTPANPDGKLGMQWRNILRVPERTFRFAFTTRF